MFFTVLPVLARAVRVMCYAKNRAVCRGCLTPATGGNGDESTGAILLVVFINKTKISSSFYPLKANASSFTTQGLVEGRTASPPTTTDSPFSTRPIQEKAALRSPTVTIRRNKLDFRLRPVFLDRQHFRTVRFFNSLGCFFRFSNRHCAWGQLHRRFQLGCSSTHCCRHCGNYSGR